MTKKLRELIISALKTYDDDLRDDILEEIDEVDRRITRVLNDTDNYKEFIEDRIHNKDEIDFGIAKLYYGTHKGGSALLDELIQAIKDKAMVVPLYDMVTAIKRL